MTLTDRIYTYPCRIPADFRDQKKRLKSMFTKSDLYLWLVLTMGIFYGIPAIQLMLNNQQRLKETGDLDLCYYNSLCSTQVGSS